MRPQGSHWPLEQSSCLNNHLKISCFGKACCVFSQTCKIIIIYGCSLLYTHAAQIQHICLWHLYFNRWGFHFDGDANTMLRYVLTLQANITR